MRLFQLVTLAITVLLPLAAASQALTSDQVPALVKQAFERKFPAVKAAAWKLKSDKNYEAEFTVKGIERAVKFDAAGKWLETETAISHSKVPKAVRKAADNQFSGYKVTETQSLQRWNEDSLAYELHFENATELVKAQFSADGTVLSKSSKPKPDKAKQ